MQIHQLNIQYQADQDRILARINTSTGTELRLWLTRRLTLGLLPILRKVEGDQLQKSLISQPDDSLGMTANDPKVREMLGEFKKEQTLQQADFKTPYKQPVPGATTEPPLLIVEAQLTPLDNFNTRLKFLAVSAESTHKREIKMELDPKLMRGMVHLMDKAFADSHWDQSATLPDQPLPSNANTADDDRPRYLN